MLTVITLACLYLCPNNPTDQINVNEWQTHTTELERLNAVWDATNPPEKPQIARNEPRPQHTPNPAPLPPTTTGVEQWRPLVNEYFGDLGPGEVERALCLMGYESGGDPNAYNPSGATGLMQVLKSWADNFGLVPADLFDPRHNLNVSRALYNDNGWRHWAPYLRGLCH